MAITKEEATFPEVEPYTTSIVEQWLEQQDSSNYEDPNSVPAQQFQATRGQDQSEHAEAASPPSVHSHSLATHVTPHSASRELSAMSDEVDAMGSHHGSVFGEGDYGPLLGDDTGITTSIAGADDDDDLQHFLEGGMQQTSPDHESASPLSATDWIVYCPGHDKQASGHATPPSTASRRILTTDCDECWTAAFDEPGGM